MRPQDVIRRKRDRGELSEDEIAFFVRGVTTGEWADYQAAALLMAIFLNGMSERERLALTAQMLRSGRTLDFSHISQPKVDKHSTGGVGDKTSLVLAPLAAALGLCVPMISGRGLGHTGGTLDKLEAIPGYRVRLSLDEFSAVLERVGFAMIGQTEEIAPADRKLYALRDVTATVESIPLIAASIMSKKLAEGLDGLVLDVKVGSGAFMKRRRDARALARALVEIGRGAAVRTVALLTYMDQPLGRAVGNALEVAEAIETLRGRGPRDLTHLCVELTAHMLVVGGTCDALERARQNARAGLRSGAGLEKLRQSIEAQGGNPSVVDDPSLLPRAQRVAELSSDEAGYVAALDAERVGVASMILGAGRVRVEDEIDPSVGIVLAKKIGDPVKRGETLARIHYNDERRLAEARDLLRSAYRFSDARPRRKGVIAEVIA
ncbi:MAG: thymidine phosphorylase [Pyrinomonas sp.]|uniref:thymidine phosphorylase n=1 Tax=Pyrinomonas sp. TaxID=2080306 RepID=UPI003331D2F9